MLYGEVGHLHQPTESVPTHSYPLSNLYVQRLAARTSSSSFASESE
jgi:hypothetical protein